MRPRRALMGMGFLCFALALVPLTAALVLASHNRNNLVIAVAVDALVMLIGLTLLTRQAMVFTEVTDTVLRGNGIFSPVHEVPIGEVACVRRIEVLREDREAAPQTIMLDEDERVVFRLRDYYWHPADLARLTAAIDTGAPPIIEQLTENEFALRYPDAQYWFENNPAIRALGWFALGIFALGAVAFFLVISR